MADTTFVAQSTTILAAWLNVVNNLIYRGANPNYVTTTGAANAYTVTLPATSLLTTLVTGTEITAKASFANTGATTLTLVGGANLGAVAVQLGAAALTGGEIPSGSSFKVVYDGTVWQLVSVNGNVVRAGLATASGLTMSTARLLGRTTASTGAIEEISVGAGLTLSAGTLVAVSNSINTVTLTSASPSSTLTSSSNKQIRILTDTTVPLNPSIVMPDMTTMTAGGSVFTFENTTPYPVALKSSSGTIREFVPPFGKFSVTITDVSTATGAWFLQNPQAMVGDNLTTGQALAVPYPVNSGYTSTTLGFVQLDSTNFAWLWSEQSAAGTTVYTYAKLYTINTTTQVITAGTRVTIRNGLTATTLISSPSNLVWDTDNNGLAFCQIFHYTQNPAACCTYTYVNTISYFGLGVSAGTLAVSAISTVTDTGNLLAASSQYVMYLGSNNAFAYGAALNTAASGATYSYKYRMAKLQTPSAPAITESASNTTLSAAAIPLYSRTSLTGSTICFPALSNKAIAYTAAANTFSTNNRTVTTTTLDIEQGSIAQYGSFGMGGFMYASGKVMFGPQIYDVTNDGAAGVTAVPTAGANLKTTATTAYQSLVAPTMPALRVGLPPAATDCQSISYGSMGGSARLNNLNTAATWDGSVSGALAGSAATLMGQNPLAQPTVTYTGALMMSTTDALFFKTVGQAKCVVAFAKIATPII